MNPFLLQLLHHKKLPVRKKKINFLSSVNFKRVIQNETAAYTEYKFTGGADLEYTGSQKTAYNDEQKDDVASRTADLSLI